MAPPPEANYNGVGFEVLSVIFATHNKFPVKQHHSTEVSIICWAVFAKQFCYDDELNPILFYSHFFTNIAYFCDAVHADQPRNIMDN